MDTVKLTVNNSKELKEALRFFKSRFPKASKENKYKFLRAVTKSN